MKRRRTARDAEGAAGSPVLQVRGLTVTRRGTTILHGVDWTVQPGEMWTILGANGSGKTSLLQCLTAYLTPAGGTISVLEGTYGATDWTELRKSIGIVSSGVRQRIDEEERTFEVIAGGRYGQINYWGRLTEEDRRLTRAIARRVGCTHLLERPWAVLSQGERQRVLTGRALIAKPRLLILDEPCAGLDPVAREHFTAFVQSLAARSGGPALVLVTHHLEEIPPACTHVLALRGGRVEKAGRIADVLRAPVLSRVFGAPVRVRRNRDRWMLALSGGPHTGRSDGPVF